MLEAEAEDTDRQGTGSPVSRDGNVLYLDWVGGFVGLGGVLCKLIELFS